MLIGRIRPLESRTIDIDGDTFEEQNASLRAAMPDGWEITGPREISRRDDVREIEGEDFAAVRAQVPEGWQLLSVR